jgi:hypothetical protein
MLSRLPCGMKKAALRQPRAAWRINSSGPRGSPFQAAPIALPPASLLAFDLQQLDFEYQRFIGSDTVAGTALAVTQLRRNE